MLILDCRVRDWYRYTYVYNVGIFLYMNRFSIQGVQEETCSSPAITLVGTAGHQCAQKNNKIFRRKQNDGSIQYFTSSSANPPIDTTQLNAFKSAEGNWSSFDEYKKHANGIWVVTVWGTQSDCTCPYYLKHLNCKYSLGLLIRLKFAEAPESARSVPFGQKRKRGRPAKAKRALIVQ